MVNENEISLLFFDLCSTVPSPGIGNRVTVRDCVRTATAIAVHSFRIAVFCYGKRSSSGEETNRVQIAVCLFSPQFKLGLNFSYTCSYSTVYEQFYKTFSRLVLIFCSLFSSFCSQDEVKDPKIE